MEPNFLAATFLYVGGIYLIDISRESNLTIFIFKNVACYLLFLLAVSV